MRLSCVWDAPRPFVHPLTTPAGAVLSVEAPADHPWHHALWFTIKFVNGENFWEEYGEFGTLRTLTIEESPSGDDTVSETTARIEWIAPDGSTPRLHETRTIRTEAIDAAAYAIDWIETIEAPVDTVLDRTPFTTWGGYGGLTLRGAPDWTDTSIRLDDGIERERCLGEPSPWLSIEGATPVGRAGVKAFDHPDNPRAPSPWYASTRADTYGEGWANFVNAAFLWNEPLAIGAGVPLSLRYRLIVHDGPWAVERIEAEYQRWLA